MASFCMIAERNQAKARRRYLRARRLTPLDDDGAVWDEDSYLDEPSADESLPPEPSDFSLTLPGELSLPLASPDPRLTDPSMKRSGDTLESGSTEERKKEEGAHETRERQRLQMAASMECIWRTMASSP